MRLVWLKDELLKAANDEIKSAERESWEDAPELIPSMQVYHYHNDHLGTPNELTNSQGEVVWLADYEAWGNTAKVVWREESLSSIKVSADELQPIRFQGQSFDTETGLHYNRFRYFDPDLGMFISRDPIGLLGGENVFAYAPNPTGWIDPFGLASAGGGGAYMFEWKNGGRYIGKGLLNRARKSKDARKKGAKDCLLSFVWISTEGDNEMGKMVENRVMVKSGFGIGMGRNSPPPGYANAHLSGQTAYAGATEARQIEANRLADLLIAAFVADKATRKLAINKCK